MFSLPLLDRILPVRHFAVRKLPNPIYDMVQTTKLVLDPTWDEYFSAATANDGILTLTLT